MKYTFEGNDHLIEKIKISLDDLHDARPLRLSDVERIVSKMACCSVICTNEKDSHEKDSQSTRAGLPCVHTCFRGLLQNSYRHLWTPEAFSSYSSNENKNKKDSSLASRHLERAMNEGLLNEDENRAFRYKRYRRRRKYSRQSACSSEGLLADFIV